MAAASTTSTQTLGISPGADWRIDDVVAVAGGGHRYRLTSPEGVQFPGGVRLMGRFNVENAALAQAMLIVAGVDAGQAAAGIEQCPGVPGRMERVGDDTEGIALLVDYAHTADALARALDAVRPHDGGRVLVVFGCGGDRDARKRPEMGRAAAEHADVVVVTDDNPRTESPETIRRAVLDGVATVDPARRAEVREVGDRRAAIRWAVSNAHPGDVVLVAGKGHESGQESGGVVSPFDDRDEVREAWRHRVAAAGGAAT